MTVRFRSVPRRRLGGILIGAVLALLAVGVSQGLASARADGTATAPVQYHNGLCGHPSNKKFIGTAQFTLKGGMLTVSVQIHGGDPGSYELIVYDGNCNNFGSLGFFKVDAGGNGAKTGSLPVTGHSFFATAKGPGHSNDSLIVKL